MVEAEHPAGRLASAVEPLPAEIPSGEAMAMAKSDAVEYRLRVIA